MARQQERLKQQEAMANKEVLDAIAASTKTYLDAEAASKAFYSQTIKASEERITAKINEVVVDVKKNTTDIKQITVRVGANESTIGELVAFKEEYEERQRTMETKQLWPNTIA